MKMGTAIFNGNFNMKEYADASTPEERLRCLVKLVEQDNKVMHFGIEDCRIKTVWKKIVAPIKPDGFNNRVLHHVENELTLPSKAVGRLEPYFCFEDLPIWGPDAELGRIDREEWGPLLNVAWSFWESTEACAFLRIEETQPDKKWGDKSACAKALNHIANTACIRATGQWCNGTLATETEREWAEGAWPFSMKEEAVGYRGQVIKPTEGLMSYRNK